MAGCFFARIRVTYLRNENNCVSAPLREGINSGSDRKIYPRDSARLESGK